MSHVTRYRHILLLVASVAAFAVALRCPQFEVGACTGPGVQGAQPVANTILPLVEAGLFPDPDADTLRKAWLAFPLLFVMAGNCPSEEGRRGNLRDLFAGLDPVVA